MHLQRVLIPLRHSEDIPVLRIRLGHRVGTPRLNSAIRRRATLRRHAPIPHRAAPTRRRHILLRRLLATDRQEEEGGGLQVVAVEEIEAAARDLTGVNKLPHPDSY